MQIAVTIRYHVHDNQRDLLLKVGRPHLMAKVRRLSGRSLLAGLTSSTAATR